MGVSDGAEAGDVRAGDGVGTGDGVRGVGVDMVLHRDSKFRVTELVTTANKKVSWCCPLRLPLFIEKGNMGAKSKTYQF